jgi:hypothetical protein
MPSWEMCNWSLAFYEIRSFIPTFTTDHYRYIALSSYPLDKCFFYPFTQTSPKFSFILEFVTSTRLLNLQKIFVYLMLSPQITYSVENQWSLTLLFVYQSKILIVVWIRIESVIFFYASPRSAGLRHRQRYVLRRVSGGETVRKGISTKIRSDNNL